MSQCKQCRLYAINHNHHGRDGSDPDLCDVCFWRKRAEEAAAIEREAWRSGLSPIFRERMGAEQVREVVQSVIRARCEK